jgi:hypothetical protein
LQIANCKLQIDRKEDRAVAAARPRKRQFAICNLQFAICNCALLLLTAAPVRACDTPVYRYALEHWPADSYRAAVLHRGPLPAETQLLVDHLKERAASANLTVQVIDLDRPTKADFPERLRTIDVSKGPVLVLNYPAATKIEADVWSGPLRPEAVAALLDSPARHEVAGRLHAGETVWLLLEGGKKEADEAAAKVIGEGRPAAPASSLLRVRRDDPAERMLVRILLGSEPDLAGRAEPMAFPVFGRGRLLYALVGAGITADNVRRAASFLGGDCSCTVKRDNPGTDLLLAADWGDVEALPARAAVADAGATDEPAAQPAPAPGASWPRAALWVAVVFAGGLVLLTGTLALRARKQPPP